MIEKDIVVGCNNKWINLWGAKINRILSDQSYVQKGGFSRIYILRSEISEVKTIA
jgi:hypothetical protein